MIKILIAEDDRQLNEGIKLSLQTEDRKFLQSYTAKETECMAVREAPDLIILDINFPDGNGLDLLKKFRVNGIKAKVILLTANNMETDIVVGLESGADDYITKPFSLMVLRARVSVQLRNNQDTVLTEGEFRFDFNKMIFSVKGQAVELSKTEQKLLRILLEHKGRVVTREQLIDYIWDGDCEYVDGHALTVTMKRLRQKLGEGANDPSYIRTVYGIGYSFE